LYHTKPGNPVTPTISPRFTLEWSLENSASSRPDLLKLQKRKIIHLKYKRSKERSKKEEWGWETQ
jgi:hypothetical protein